jgi:protein-S-isoprenylcysteine O-methyltransferase Ste14
MTQPMRDQEHGFVARGGVWVIAQLSLMVALGAAGPLEGDWFQGPAWSKAAALGCLGIGAWLGISGARDLGSNRTPYPRPQQGSSLVETGIYSRVRHPLYAALIWLGYGLGLAFWSRAALGLAVAQQIFFHAKARREERWLAEKFPGYAAYASRVNRFFPCRR